LAGPRRLLWPALWRIGTVWQLLSGSRQEALLRFFALLSSFVKLHREESGRTRRQIQLFETFLTSVFRLQEISRP
jgi:hypothetical protein